MSDLSVITSKSLIRLMDIESSATPADLLPIYAQLADLSARIGVLESGNALSIKGIAVANITGGAGDNNKVITYDAATNRFILK